MWNDPIVEETRCLRDEYASKFNYDIRAIVEDLKQWERQGFPAAAKPRGDYTAEREQLLKGETVGSIVAGIKAERTGGS